MYVRQSVNKMNTGDKAVIRVVPYVQLYSYCSKNIIYFLRSS